MADGGYRGRGRGQSQGGRGAGGPPGGFQNFQSGGRGRGGSIQVPRGVFKQNGQLHQTSMTVRKLEDETFKQGLVAGMQKLSVSDQTTIPRRPGYGTKGRAITLWANYFELLASKTMPLNRYAVSIIDEKKVAPTGKKLARCMQLLIAQLPNTMSIASDYRMILITSAKLPFTDREYNIDYYSETQNGPDNKSPKYRAMIKFTGVLTFGELLDYLSSTDLNREQPTSKEELLQAVNIIIASGMKSNPQIITKNNKYFPAADTVAASGKVPYAEGTTIATGLNAFRGFFMSVRAATGRVLLNMQVQHVAVWETQPMLTLLSKLIQTDHTPMSDVHRMIARLVVQVSHLNNRIKRVAGFALTSDGQKTRNPPRMEGSYANANQVRFWREQPAPARYVTVAEHFRDTYRPLTTPNAPLLNVGSRDDPIYMPSELCMIKRLQTYDKKLPGPATDRMIKFAVRRPEENAETIVTNGLGMLKANSGSMLQNFGVQIKDQMAVVHARLLDSPALAYSGKQVQRPRDASWNMMGTQFNSGANLNRWTYLWIRIQKIIKDKDGNEVVTNWGGDIANQESLEILMSDFHKTLGTCGIKAPKWSEPQVLNLVNANDPSQEIDKVFSQIDRAVQLVVVVLPRKDTPMYNAVKRAGDIKYGFHTVSVVADKKKFCKALYSRAPGPGIQNVQYHANVALKVNLKLGGRNQVLQDADLGFVSKGKTMLVGLDVTHPAPGSATTAPSVSSITASIDSKLGQWPAAVTIQTGFKEMIVGLKDMFKSRLELWRRHQKALPEQIIVYRDGVGDGMYELVRSQELTLIREACKELYPASDTKVNKPYISIIICGKRHHTRFYPTDEKEAEARTGCTRSGTVVDRDVTEARLWDFYLQAHTALHGTPRPAHYVVIHDEIFRRGASQTKSNDGRTEGQRAADELERLTHTMCYMFGRATKAVSLCPPAYYADIVCERTRTWLSKVFEGDGQGEVNAAQVQVHQRLKDTMFYI